LEQFSGDYSWAESYEGAEVGSNNSTYIHANENEHQYGLRLRKNGRYTLYLSDQKITSGKIENVTSIAGITTFELSSDFGNLVWDGVTLSSDQFPHEGYTNLFLKQN
jgi:hypothetical protein